MKSKALFSGLIFSLIGALLLLQINTVVAFTSVENNPITAAITSVINVVVNTNTTNGNTPNSNTPAPAQQPNSTHLITTAITVPSPTPSGNPVTSPITEPTPTPDAAPSQPGQPTNNPSPEGPSAPQAPICGDSKPVSAPKLVNAFASGKNEVTLIWSSALDPVNYYLIAYGTKPNQPEFGNPNIGGKYTTSYIVTGLSGNTTYYFKVRAGNGCMPGDFSNEVAVKTTGPVLKTPASGFKAGVLGKSKQEVIINKAEDLPFKPITEVKPERVVTSSQSFFTKIKNFFTNLFRFSK